MNCRKPITYNENKLAMVCNKYKLKLIIKIFFQDKNKIQSILSIAYFWIAKASYTTTCLITGIFQQISRISVISLMPMLRKLAKLFS